MAKLLTAEEMNKAQNKYIVAFVCLTAGYITLMSTVGFWAALGVFLVHTGINFQNAGQKITEK